MIHSRPLVQPLRAVASGKFLSLLPKQLKSSFEEEREKMQQAVVLVLVY